MRVSRLLPVACLVLSGCFVSRTHLGFHHLGDDNVWHSIVGKKHVEPLRDREDRWMALLSKLDLEALSADFAPRLSAEMNAGVREKLALQLERDYRPDGNFRRRRFGTPAFSIGRGVRRDAFEHYDMVGYAYQMEGKVEAGVQFYLARVGEDLKICGIEISPTLESDREKAKDVRFVFPETVDRSGVKPRPGMLMKRM